MNLFNRSNQNGAPSEAASAVNTQPAIAGKGFALNWFASPSQPMGRVNDCSSFLISEYLRL